MNRGFIGGVFVAVIAVVIAGVVWWSFTHDANVTTVFVPSAQAQGIPVVFTYTANKTEFPSGVFQIIGDTRVLGANYIRARNTAETVYGVLGKSAGTPLADSCQWTVRAVIEIKNPKLDTSSYAYVDPMPTVAVADVTGIISRGEPQQICAAP